MLENIKRVNNPLTIIALFAALAEINATVAIGLLDKSLHGIFIWFMILFPTILVIAFFLTLNFNVKVMYSPSDYKDDGSFMNLIKSPKLYGSEIGVEDSEIQKFREQINGIESRLGNVASKIADQDTKMEIEGLRNDLKESTKEIELLSLETKAKLLEFSLHPAYYTLIYAIVKSNSKTPADLNNYVSRGSYFVPGEWTERALPRLLSSGLIIGEVDSFSLNPDYKDELSKRVTENHFRLIKLSKMFKEYKSAESPEWRDRLWNRINIYVEKLVF